MASLWINLAALAALFLLAGATIVFARGVARRRRDGLMNQPFPESWERILREGFPIYPSLPEPARNRLRRYMHVFLAEKSFEGCGGLELTEEMKTLIAGQACLLLLNGKGNFYPNLRSILIYPAAYENRNAELFSAMHDPDDAQINAGESWSSGSVILSWRDVVVGAANHRDAYNVVLHEFAHQLDQLNGAADGAPVLHHRSDYCGWAKIFGDAYEAFTERVDRGKRTVFDDYGATGPEEFFAVATETYFEKPHQLKKSYPALYDEFRKFYDLDPASWK